MIAGRWKKLMDENEKFLLNEIKKMKKQVITEYSVICKEAQNE
jgi:hypothetical protein